MDEQTTGSPQAIAEHNVEAILDGAERLLQDRRQPSISAVASEAGVSVEILDETQIALLDRDPSGRAQVAALTRLVHAQDTAMVTAWACEISDEIPAFETWAHPERAA